MVAIVNCVITVTLIDVEIFNVDCKIICESVKFHFCLKCVYVILDF
jgi:hypothetical protein